MPVHPLFPMGSPPDDDDDGPRPPHLSSEATKARDDESNNPPRRGRHKANQSTPDASIHQCSPPSEPIPGGR